ncbi:MAG: OmpA family protein [Burkholderiales bacterium]|jgi:phosphate transport system substrate-binding protein|nr:OmpA family protein [Burkholderiales bacterium]
MCTGWRALLLAPFILILSLVGRAAPNDDALTSAIEGQVLLKMASERVVGSSVTEALIRTYMAHEGLRDIEIKRTSDLNKSTYTGIAGKGLKRSVIVSVMPREQSLAALRRGEVDVALVAQQRVSASRKIGRTELLAAGSDSQHIQIGETAAFIIVSPQNPVGELTFRQLRLLLLGAVTDWSQLGGRPGKINPVGTAQMQPAIDLVADLIHLDPDNLDPEAEKLLRSRREAPNPISILPNRDELFERIASDRNAITVQFPHIPPSVKALRLGPDAKKFTGPDADTIKSKLYPLAYRINLHYPNGSIQPAVASLVRASTSLEMEVNLTLAGAALPGTEMLFLDPDPKAPTGYLEATKYGMMISKSIHFKADSLELTDDGKSAISRVADKLLSIRQDAGKIRLIGFSDSLSSTDESKASGLALANVVAAELKKRNVNTGYIYSFGDTMPLDEDSTTYGRERNRRVQVWIVP